jgi:hypothetical protein
MKIRPIILSVIFAVLGVSCQVAETQKQLSSTNYSDTDSVKVVASYFLSHDVFINSFIVSDRDIEEAYQENKDWVKKFFPAILKKYDLTLYSQFSLAIYLYLEGEKEHLKKLWTEYGRLAGDKDMGTAPNQEFKPILNLLEYHQISLR